MGWKFSVYTGILLIRYNTRRFFVYRAKNLELFYELVLK